MNLAERLYTVEEYLAMEDGAEIKFDSIDVDLPRQEIYLDVELAPEQ